MPRPAKQVFFCTQQRATDHPRGSRFPWSPGDMDPTQARIDRLAPLARAICRALADELTKLGFTPGSVPIADPATASYRLAREPASGEDGLVGEWRDAKGQRRGSLVFHGDGTFFVEHDVIRAHPRDPRWFVEAVQAWGRGDAIRAEPRLLPAAT